MSSPIQPSTIGSLFLRSTPEPIDTRTRDQRYADAATKATKVDPKVLLSAADDAFKLMSQAAATGPSAPPLAALERPQLAPPKLMLPNEEKAKQDTLTFLMARLMQLLGEVSVNSTQARLEMLKSIALAASVGYERQSADYQRAVAELDAAVGNAQTSEAELIAARAQLAAATERLAVAESALEGLDPESDEYKAAVAARDTAQAAVNAAGQRVGSAQVAHQRNVDIAVQAGERVQQLGNAMGTIKVALVPSSSAPENEKANLKELDAASRMTALLFRFAELMGNAQEAKLELDQSMFKEMQEARQAYMERKSQEYLEAVAKAEKAAKVSKCIGILVGIALVIASVVLAPTGIGAVVVGAIGVALLTMQTLNTLGVTSFDPLAPLMDPLMKGLMFIIEPLGKLLSTVWQYTPIGALLNAVLPEDAMEIANTVVGMAAAMALLVVAAILLGPAAGSVVGSVMSKMGQVLSKVVTKMTEEMIKPMFAKINEMIADSVVMQQIKTFIAEMLKKMVSADGLLKSAFSGPNGQLWVARIQMATVAVELGGTAASSGLNVAAGAYRYKAGQALSEVQMLQFISEQLKTVLAQAVQVYTEQASETKSFEIKLIDMLEQQAGTARFVAHQKI